MNHALEWLDRRRPVPPDSLRAAMEHALARDEAAAGTVPERLAASALESLAAVVEGGGGRAVATDLLVADGLLTLACEAAAEAGPGPLDDLLAGLDPGRFAAVLKRVDRR